MELNCPEVKDCLERNKIIICSLKSKNGSRRHGRKNKTANKFGPALSKLAKKLAIIMNQAVRSVWEKGSNLTKFYCYSIFNFSFLYVEKKMTSITDRNTGSVIESKFIYSSIYYIFIQLVFVFFLTVTKRTCSFVNSI